MTTARVVTTIHAGTRTSQSRSDSLKNQRACSTSLAVLSLLQLYHGSSIYHHLCFAHRHISDIAHIHLLQHLLLAEEALGHIKGLEQLLFLQFVAHVAH